MFKEKNGITLIALVITIIVILILAGVTINLVVGENGVIARAQEAKEEMELASMVEELNLKLAEWQIDLMSIAASGELPIETMEDMGIKGLYKMQMVGDASIPHMKTEFDAIWEVESGYIRAALVMEAEGEEENMQYRFENVQRVYEIPDDAMVLVKYMNMGSEEESELEMIDSTELGSFNMIYGVKYKDVIYDIQMKIVLSSTFPEMLLEATKRQ